jgi:DNA-directed RNA polymerase subunit M/transcription elongation factor TFIIS
MDFCPKCGSILQTAKKDLFTLKCPRCKFKKQIEHREPVKKVSLKLGKVPEIAVIDENQEVMLRLLPTIHLVCEICGNTESETWNVETANETIHSTISFFRCTKCKATRRESG